MSIWDRIGAKEFEKASSTQGGLYFKPGNYLVQIQRCKMITTRDKHEAFIAEFKVHESDNAELPINSEPALYIDMDGKFPESALGDVKEFMEAGLSSLAKQHGVHVEEATPQLAKAITEEENLLAGAWLSVNAYNKLTKSGGDFTRFKWRTPDNIVQLAKAS